MVFISRLEHPGIDLKCNEQQPGNHRKATLRRTQGRAQALSPCGGLHIMGVLS